MAIFIKVLIILLLIAIFFALGTALYYLVSGKPTSTEVVKALTWRIALSFVLFVLLFIAFSMGWITPHVYSMVNR